MPSLKKKTQLLKFLKTLNKDDFTEAAIINDIITELETLRAALPQENLSPYFETTKTLEKEYSNVSNSVTGLSQALSKASQEFQKFGELTDERLINISKETTKVIKDLKDELEKTQVQVLELRGRGGGSKPLQFQVNNTVANIRYADINLVGSGITASNDDTNKITTITISSVASNSFLSATGTIDDSNTVFGFASLPSIININGGFYQQTGGAISWTWNAGTLQATLSSPVGINGSIWGLK